MLSDSELAVAAAEAGASVARERYGKPFARFEKLAMDFATDVDLAAEKAVTAVLRVARPTDGIEGEELGTVGTESADRTWLVDPICGTLNFAAQTPLLAVNVALCTDDHVAVAASADPLADEVFWTDGRHAYVRRAGADEQLTPSPSSRLVDVNLDPPFPNGDRFRAVRMLADSAFVDRFRPRVVSTSLAVAWVAAGRRAAYVTDGHMRGSVHFSSGIALCEAAGCIVTGLRGEAVHTGVGGLVVAADEETHSALITIIDQQFTT
ncbi:inositol monophosphatase family protein [Phytoactinopolyspora endophytica]|uniref:inositol monophosphatase family protein n=1 Tax=Phytoactinopolyspora endophytica TaxID=1642495 RepID=UPI00101D14D2|nr:inositol monophosphatase family protein [Phytoactinopolyspora endophytica]